MLDNQVGNTKSHDAQVKCIDFILRATYRANGSSQRQNDIIRSLL